MNTANNFPAGLDIEADDRCEGDHVWHTTLLLHLLKELSSSVTLGACSMKQVMSACTHHDCSQALMLTVLQTINTPEWQVAGADFGRIFDEETTGDSI